MSKHLGLIIFYCIFLTKGYAIEIKGYYKNISIFSKKFIDLNRFRMQINLPVYENISFNADCDNELFLGSYLKTDEFKIAKNIKTDDLVNLEKSIVDNDNLLWKVSFYRLFATYYSDVFELTIGRQRVALGTAKFWNPTDIINPYNPLQIEINERYGVDAITSNLFINDLTTISFIYDIKKKWENSTMGGRIKTTIGSYDVSFLAAKYKNEEILGADFSGYINDASFYGEVSYINAIKFSVGIEYIFSGKLYLDIEYYYNEYGKDKKNYEWQKLLSGEILSLAKNYIGIAITYNLTELLKISSYMILNIHDKSFFLGPSMSYSLTENMDLMISNQIFSGEQNTEFGSFNSNYYLQLQYFY